MSLIKGREVTVIRRVQTGTDNYNAPVYETKEEPVPGVLPQPGSVADLEDERPDGSVVSMTFHFPKGYGKSLRGCSIAYDGNVYRVIGDPQPYVEENTPGEWDMPVETERVDG